MKRQLSAKFRRYYFVSMRPSIWAAEKDEVVFTYTLEICLFVSKSFMIIRKVDHIQI